MQHRPRVSTQASDTFPFLNATVNPPSKRHPITATTSSITAKENGHQGKPSQSHQTSPIITPYQPTTNDLQNAMKLLDRCLSADASIANASSPVSTAIAQLQQQQQQQSYPFNNNIYGHYDYLPTARISGDYLQVLLKDSRSIASSSASFQGSNPFLVTNQGIPNTTPTASTSAVTSAQALSTAASMFPSILKRKSFTIPKEISTQVDRVFAQSNGSCAAFLGVMPSIDHAWIAIDDRLFLWNFLSCPAGNRSDSHQSAAKTSSIVQWQTPEEQPIVKVALVAVSPQSQSMASSGQIALDHLLVIACPESIFLLAVAMESSSSYSTTSSNTLRRMHLIETGMSINCLPCKRVIDIVGMTNGRIVIVGDDGHLYELAYQLPSSLLSSSSSSSSDANDNSNSRFNLQWLTSKISLPFMSASSSNVNSTPSVSSSTSSTKRSFNEAIHDNSEVSLTPGSILSNPSETVTKRSRHAPSGDSAAFRSISFVSSGDGRCELRDFSTSWFKRMLPARTKEAKVSLVHANQSHSLLFALNAKHQLTIYDCSRSTSTQLATTSAAANSAFKAPSIRLLYKMSSTKNNTHAIGDASSLYEMLQRHIHGYSSAATSTHPAMPVALNNTSTNMLSKDDFKVIHMDSFPSWQSQSTAQLSGSSTTPTLLNLVMVLADGSRIYCEFSFQSSPSTKQKTPSSTEPFLEQQPPSAHHGRTNSPSFRIVHYRLPCPVSLPTPTVPNATSTANTIPTQQDALRMAGLRRYKHALVSSGCFLTSTVLPNGTCLLSSAGQLYSSTSSPSTIPIASQPLSCSIGCTSVSASSVIPSVTGTIGSSMNTAYGMSGAWECWNEVVMDDEILSLHPYTSSSGSTDAENKMLMQSALVRMNAPGILAMTGHPSTSTTNISQAIQGINELLFQHFTSPAEFLILSQGGIQLVRKVRPLDRLQMALTALASVMSGNPTDDGSSSSLLHDDDHDFDSSQNNFTFGSTPSAWPMSNSAHSNSNGTVLLDALLQLYRPEQLIAMTVLLACQCLIPNQSNNSNSSSVYSNILSNTEQQQQQQQQRLLTGCLFFLSKMASISQQQQLGNPYNTLGNPLLLNKPIPSISMPQQQQASSDIGYALSVPELSYSAMHNGIYLAAARLLRPLLKTKLSSIWSFKSSSNISSNNSISSKATGHGLSLLDGMKLVQKARFLSLCQGNLASLQRLMSAHLGIPQSTATATAATSHSASSAVQSNPLPGQLESESLIALSSLVDRMAQVLAFVVFCLESGCFGHSHSHSQSDSSCMANADDSNSNASIMMNAAMADLINLEQLVSTDHGSQVIRQLAQWLVRREIRLDRSIVALCQLLQSRCPSFFGQPDVQMMRAEECLFQASCIRGISSGSLGSSVNNSVTSSIPMSQSIPSASSSVSQRERNALIEESLSLFLQAIPHLASSIAMDTMTMMSSNPNNGAMPSRSNRLRDIAAAYEALNCYTAPIELAIACAHWMDGKGIAFWMLRKTASDSSTSNGPSSTGQSSRLIPEGVVNEGDADLLYQRVNLIYEVVLECLSHLADRLASMSASSASASAAALNSQQSITTRLQQAFTARLLGKQGLLSSTSSDAQLQQQQQQLSLLDLQRQYAQCIRQCRFAQDQLLRWKFLDWCIRRADHSSILMNKSMDSANPLLSNAELLESDDCTEEFLAQLHKACLLSRGQKDRMDLLWRYYLAVGRPRDAVHLLVAISEGSKADLTLAERIEYLAMAAAHATALVSANSGNGMSADNNSKGLDDAVLRE